MTEEKRFKLSSETVLNYQIMDNDTDLNESEVVDLLNKQDKIIEEQKQRIKVLEYELDANYLSPNKMYEKWGLVE